jgi:NADH:ubiquinone oxidoreductase subunit F (NADH-binding)
MSTAPTTTPPGAALTVPRLVPSPAATTLAAHLARFGPLPIRPGGTLVDEIRAAGLRGRGGAGFPTAVKLTAVAAVEPRGRLGRRRPAVVVANGTEGEPASRKDTVLLTLAPHLVLDGVIAAVAAVGADRAIVCVDRANRAALDAVRGAVAERTDVLEIEILPTPSRYVAGEESALIRFVDGGDAKPTMTPPRPDQRGVGGRPTLVNNVETLANIALIARFGAARWRRAGTPDDPGSALFTISGGVDRPGVYELPLGVELGAVLGHAGAQPATGILLGGYFGTWLSPATAGPVHLGVAEMAAVGAGLGCGAIVVLPATVCPLAEVARVTHWMAKQSAGQCGPCRFGLPAIADALDAVVAGECHGRAEAALRRWLAMVDGRGACKLPDGVTRFVGSALDVFATHLDEHHRGATCATGTSPVLPVPAREAAWR